MEKYHFHKFNWYIQLLDNRSTAIYHPWSTDCNRKERWKRCHLVSCGIYYLWILLCAFYLLWKHHPRIIELTNGAVNLKANYEASSEFGCTILRRPQSNLNIPNYHHRNTANQCVIAFRHHFYEHQRRHFVCRHAVLSI